MSKEIMLKAKQNFQENSNNKGITLVALVITIIIIIILAVVAISFAFGDNGLIKRAEDAGEYYANDTTYTEDSITNVESYINDILAGTGGETQNPATTVAEAKENGQKFTDTKSITDDSGDTVYIPGGFGVASDSATDADDGVVITDGTNEFVWIPVDDASLTEMYNTTTPETGVDIELGKSSLNEETTTTKLFSKARIRDLEGFAPGVPSSKNLREPDILIDTTYGDAVTEDATKGINLIKSVFEYTDSTETGVLKHFAQDMVDEYEAVFNSVRKYDGFYIGRYELTGTVESPTVKRGEPVLTADYYQAQNWYGLKKSCSEIVKTSAAQSIMIYGNQWDEVMDWLVDTEEKNESEINVDSSTWGNYNDSREEAAVEGAGKRQDAGHSDAWSANNIYDLAGNYFEYTQEANQTYNRILRGRLLWQFNGRISSFIS